MLRENILLCNWYCVLGEVNESHLVLQQLSAARRYVECGVSSSVVVVASRSWV